MKAIMMGSKVANENTEDDPGEPDVPASGRGEIEASIVLTKR